MKGLIFRQLVVAFFVTCCCTTTTDDYTTSTLSNTNLETSTTKTISPITLSTTTPSTTTMSTMTPSTTTVTAPTITITPCTTTITPSITTITPSTTTIPPSTTTNTPSTTTITPSTTTTSPWTTTNSPSTTTITPSTTTIATSTTTISMTTDPTTTTPFWTTTTDSPTTTPYWTTTTNPPTTTPWPTNLPTTTSSTVWPTTTNPPTTPWPTALPTTTKWPTTTNLPTTPRPTVLPTTTSSTVWPTTTDSPTTTPLPTTTSSRVWPTTTPTPWPTPSPTTLPPTTPPIESTTMINTTIREVSTVPNTCPNNPPSDFDICPDGFSHIVSSSDLCYAIKNNQPFPPKCDYPSTVPLNSTENILSQIPSKVGFWLNVYRNKTDGFGHLEWKERGYAYGTTIPYKGLESNINHDCVIYHNKLRQRVPCSDRYDTVCVYSMERIQSSLSEMCNSTSNYTQCVIGHYDLQKPSCFCKKQNFYQPSKKDFCTKLAEPIFPYQSKLMQEYLYSYLSSCWIGLYKDKSDFRWRSTGKHVTYTWWALPAKCNEEEGAFKFNSYPDNGWFLTKDRTLDCAICEFDLVLKDSSLRLEQIKGTSNILFTIDYELYISKSFGIDLHCFTDTNEDDFKKKLNINFYDAEIIGNQMKITMNVLDNRPGYYWCVGFQYNTDKPLVSNYIVAYNQIEGYGNDFVVFVEAVNCEGLDPFINYCYKKIHQTIETTIKEKLEFVNSVRLTRGYHIEHNSTLLLNIHITTKKSQYSIIIEHNLLNEQLMTIDEQIKIRNFLSSEFCLPDNTNTSDNMILQWPLTRIGAVSIPDNKLCLDEKNNRLPVTRKCAGSFLNGGVWEKVIGDCPNNTVYSETTTDLFTILKENTTSETYVQLKNITTDNTNKEEIDVYLVSSVMKKLVVDKPTDVNSSTVTDIVSNLMNFDKALLTNSQKLLNATDEVLSSLDSIIDDVPASSTVSDKLIVQISEYLADNVIGGVLYESTEDSNGFNSSKFVPLHKDTDLNSILNDSRVEMIILTPMEHIPEKSQKLTIKIFYNDILFNEVSDNKIESNNKIVSVSVNGQPGALAMPITIAFKVPQINYAVKNCSYWQYGLNSELESAYGKWTADNSSYNNQSKFEICNFYHMTHFGLLFQGPETIGKKNVPLEIVIAVGSLLSMIGVIPIFLSAIWFKSWRVRTGNIILVNFCLSISLQSILTLLLYAVKENGALCTILGASLHYFDVSEFCWMLVIAYLQYGRFVSVFHHRQKNLLRKCLIIGWILPFVPVLVILIVAPDKYQLNSYGYCYITEQYFYYASLTPILIILGINTVIFIIIMASIRKQKSEEYAQNRTYKLEFLLAIFLFFTLGLTWFFGIAGALGGGIGFTYVFCIMSSFRGIILFLFFVLGNKELKSLWERRYRYHVKTSFPESSTYKASNSATLSN